MCNGYVARVFWPTHKPSFASRNVRIVERFGLRRAQVMSNLVASVVSLSNKIDDLETNLRNEYGPVIYEAKPAAKQKIKCTMAMIDRLAGERNNFIRVMNPTGNKKPGSIAARNYSLYGKVGEPTVTVRDFIKAYPLQDGGVTRARASLLWDIERGFIKIDGLEFETK